MTVNYMTQAVKPIDDGSPSATASKTNINDALLTLQTATSILHPGYIAGKNYLMSDSGTLTTAAPGAIDIIYLIPFRVYSTIVFTSASIRIGAGGTGSSMKSGIWANSTVSGRPLGTALYADNTGIATTGTGQTSVPLAGTLSAGFYWWGAKHTGTLPTITSVNQGLFLMPNANVTAAIGISYADAYANNIATLNFTEGATFTGTASAIAALQLNT